MQLPSLRYLTDAAQTIDEMASETGSAAQDTIISVNPYTVFIAAVLPAFFLFMYIYIKDKYQREPMRQLLRGVFYGILSVIIAFVLESSLSVAGIVPDTPHSFIGAIWKAFAGAALPEESAKLLMLWLLLRKNKYYDERFDGIVYAACVGLGFAVTENIMYLFSNINEWQSVAIGRALFAVPAHFLFAVAMGYFYSLITFEKNTWRNRSRLLWIPVLMHTIYDGLLFMVNIGTVFSGILLLAFYIFCYYMWKTGRKRITRHLNADRKNFLI